VQIRSEILYTLPQIELLQILDTLSKESSADTLRDPIYAQQMELLQIRSEIMELLQESSADTLRDPRYAQQIERLQIRSEILELLQKT
jgi:hypothetical protein